jgi:hypothetical protein
MNAKELASAIEELPQDLRLELLQKLEAKKLADIQAAGEKRRLAKLEAAMASQEMQPTIRLAAGALRRIGIHDFVKAADVAVLNKAMTEHNLDMAKRIEIKRMLSILGVID